MKEALYSTYKNGRYIGDFKAKQLYEKIGISAKTLYGYANNDYVYKKSYQFKRKYLGRGEQLEALTNEELCKEWDRVRKIINPDAKENKKEREGE